MPMNPMNTAHMTKAHRSYRNIPCIIQGSVITGYTINPTDRKKTFYRSLSKIDLILCRTSIKESFEKIGQ